MECEIITEMSLYRQSNLHRIAVFMSRSALVEPNKKTRALKTGMRKLTCTDSKRE